MTGTHKKGTNDADGNGKQGGSLPESPAARLALLEKQFAAFRALARRNGWTDA